MTKNVRKRASPTKTWLGGIVCTPMAFRVSPRTMTNRVNDVISSRTAGATAPIVSMIMMMTAWLRPPSGLVTLIATSGTSGTSGTGGTVTVGTCADGGSMAIVWADAGPASPTRNSDTMKVARRVLPLLATDGTPTRSCRRTNCHQLQSTNQAVPWPFVRFIRYRCRPWHQCCFNGR
ncbi:hypothetical protein BMS3Bbin02_00143 [bacterium BMS3Bbin02]|nr:hypothetical protein BMS3Bbin02_00143 [bacterium BMS3Bbin02]